MRIIVWYRYLKSVLAIYFSHLIASYYFGMSYYYENGDEHDEDNSNRRDLPCKLEIESISTDDCKSLVMGTNMMVQDYFKGMKEKQQPFEEIC